MEQVKGDCIDPGYIDFFNSCRCRPSVHRYHIVDIDENLQRNILASHNTASDAHRWLTDNFPAWVQKYGVNQ